MQGFMAQFALSIKTANELKYRKSQDIKTSDAKKTSKHMITKGNQQIANPNTIAMAIFNTFRFLCRRCPASVLADCSPGIFRDLSFKKMIMYSMAINTNGIKMNTTENASHIPILVDIRQVSWQRHMGRIQPARRSKK